MIVIKPLKCIFNRSK